MFKTLIQLFLVLTLFLILSIVFYKYFYDQPENKIIKEIETEKIVKDTVISEDKKDSVIYNLSYKKFDILNNAYIIEADEGTLKENSDEIFMKVVRATIDYNDKEKLFIYSSNAIFNKKTFETNFFKGVKVVYKNQILESNTLDFLFDKNIAIFKDNVRYEQLDTKMFSDEIIINLLTKEIIIKSKNNSNKVIIKKN